LPLLPSTQVSVGLAGCRQTLAGGSTQVLVGVPQRLDVAAHVLSVLATQVSWGRLHRLLFPTQVCGVMLQVCPEGHRRVVLLQYAPLPEHVPEPCCGQSPSTRQLSLVALHRL